MLLVNTKNRSMKNLKGFTSYLNFNDPKTFKKIFLKYHLPLCLFAHSYLKDMQLSEDIVQETFSRFWNDKVNIRSEATLKSFLYLCVKNNCLNYLKMEARRNKKLENYSYLESNSLYEYNVMEAELYSKMNQFINELPPKSKNIMLLALREHSNSEIAEEMNISENTVKVHKNRAYKVLRKKLKHFFSIVM